MDAVTAGNEEKSQTDRQTPEAHIAQANGTKYNFSVSEILAYLFNRSELKSVSVSEQQAASKAKNKTIDDCTSCEDLPNGKLCTKHQHLETLRILRSPNINDKCLSRAISSFPPEVELCTSSVPGKGYGVRAVRAIPEGTWIGPYEGNQIKPEDLTSDSETSYMWEIFQDGVLAHYLDGSDENHSSWMRYIRCARYKDEQNTSVMQYFGNIYYRVFKEIPPGSEILVWYDDTCPHYLGIPFRMQDIGTTASRETKVTKPQPVPVPSRIPFQPPTTGNPTLPSVARHPMMPAFVPQIAYSQHSLRPVIRPPPPLPRYQVAYPMMSRDTLLHSSFANSSKYNLRELNDAYTAAAIYGNRFPYSSGKSKSSSSVMIHNNVNSALISHAVMPYSRDPPMNQSKTPELSPNQLKSRAGSRDVPISTADPMKGNLDQNGNVQIQTTENNRHAYSDKIKEKHMGMTSSDTTITKFLSQIEEARIEEMKERQRDLQERMKETCAAQEAEDALELSIWKCGQCGKSFAQQQILQLHICSSVPEKPYKCTYCTEAFEQPSDLRTHAVIHSGKKPFKCGFCSRLFAGSTTLNNHIRTHTGERPFGCERCGREFSQASQLSRHRRALFECK